MTESWDILYERIRQRFEAVVAQWVDDVARDVDALDVRERAGEGVPTIFRKFHNLAGSSGTYGMHGVSTHAVDAVMICRRALDRDGALTSGEIGRLRAIIQAIRDEVDGSRRDTADAR